jgi:hypothetical protein
VHQYSLAYKLTVPNIQSRRVVSYFALQKNNPLYPPGTAFRNLNDFFRKLDNLEQLGGCWSMAYVPDWNTAGRCVPNMTPFYYKDTMAVLKDLVGSPRYLQYMKWAPQKLYDGEGRRVYTDLWSGNWWPRIQACPTTLLTIEIRSGFTGPAGPVCNHSPYHLDV